MSRADSANVCYHFIALPITIGWVRYPIAGRIWSSQSLAVAIATTEIKRPKRKMQHHSLGFPLIGSRVLPGLTLIVRPVTFV